MTKFLTGGMDVLNSDNGPHMELVKQGSYAWLTDETVANMEMGKDCSLRILEEKLFPQHYAIGLQNNSAYRTIMQDM